MENQNTAQDPQHDPASNQAAPGSSSSSTTILPGTALPATNITMTNFLFQATAAIEQMLHNTNNTSETNINLTALANALSFGTGQQRTYQDPSPRRTSSSLDFLHSYIPDVTSNPDEEDGTLDVPTTEALTDIVEALARYAQAVDSVQLRKMFFFCSIVCQKRVSALEDELALILGEADFDEESDGGDDDEYGYEEGEGETDAYEEDGFPGAWEGNVEVGDDEMVMS
ncbi:hypothetical protein BP5796_10947 [Coleophoma crateriformis]|uniref:Uncharacterized protein n=1 Tax=Coleophoma crateriformis TaxID=565419 RepID=A0A3D8QLG9_9HELO|nr:hypothetical protein BP5796_10947 [Coleophoma crateriformis]